MIARPISSSHVSMVNCTLGWGDKISQVFKVEGMDYDYYIECGEMTHCLGAFTLSTFQHPSFKVVLTIPHMPMMYKPCHTPLALT